MKITNYEITHRTLHFKQPAGTSRGIYTTRDIWYIHLEGENDDGTLWQGVGECAPLPDLSCDAYPIEEYEQYLHAACAMTCQRGYIPYDILHDYPSIIFGLESAMAHKEKQEKVSVSTPLPNEAKWEGSGEGLLPVCRINGLIWMGTYEEMRKRLEEKLAAGFRCIKLKIGAINFDDEIRLIRQIRDEFPADKVELRVDANGAFGTTADEAIDKLRELSKYQLHSIEQPIRQGHWTEMAKLCKQAVHTPLPFGGGVGGGTSLPIALDEELIGINTTSEKIALLDTIKPQYIILKPSLHGGFHGCDEWIRLAEERGIGWWATSALESNVGLAAIARWVSQYHPTLPQGLGTGLLYTDNTPAETEIRGEELWMI